MKKTILMSLVVFLFSNGFATAGCPTMDFTGDCRVDFADFAVLASQWLDEGYDDLEVFASQWLDEGVPEPNITWVSINDPGVDDNSDGIPDHEGFNGEMSKYETTNTQYCQFLNAALASGDVIVDGSNVKGADGSNSGYDFAGEVYYNLAGAGYTVNEATNGGAARINYTGSSFTVDIGFNDHPVTYVTWYGSIAFCNYYGYRLPTEWEWRAVADYTGSYVYGCGMDINNVIANYRNSIHPDGTVVVGSFGEASGYGYGMCDMAGNVYEWTRSDVPGYNFFVIKGGNWEYHYSYCEVSHGSSEYPDYPRHDTGFRVCRYNERLVPGVVGMAQSAAETAIVNAELTVGTVTKVCSDTIAEGNVISQAPSAGELRLLGSPVDLVVSLEHPDITWVDVNDDGSGMKDEDGNTISHGGFTGEMSKYNTTNSQYCQFLNAALDSGDITVNVSTGIVYGANGLNSGADFVDDIYFHYGSTLSQINYNDVSKSFSVIIRETKDMSNYPVIEASWYGTTAFCNYYCYRLPTEWEWQAVADYDGSYIYGCGITIDPNMANYDEENPIGFSIPPYTTPVDHYPAYGYGFCDMAGNLWEDTSTVTAGGLRIMRGSCWINTYTNCAVSQRGYLDPNSTAASSGFRACR